MIQLYAGFGLSDITPDYLGRPLMGYGNRQSGAEGVHDSLWSRALVMRAGSAAWALCAVDFCWISATTVAKVREKVSQQTDLAPAAIIVAAVHTHSGPNDLDEANWAGSLADLIAASIVSAWRALEPARLAVGSGFLYGHSLNRRWFDRPVDPAVSVLRIDNAAGEILGTVINFACHPVVLGADNLAISADFVGYARDEVEAELGGVCVFTNGACADVNPLTQGVGRQLAERRSFRTMSRDGEYYGSSSNSIEIEDRIGGTFEEAAIIGHCVAQEALYVAEGLSGIISDSSPWHLQLWVNHLEDGEALIETSAIGIGDFVMIAQPGEIFVESGLALKSELRRRGYRYPWVISYADDWQFYLTPANVFHEGGYEVERARDMNHSPDLPDRLLEAMIDAIDLQSRT
ncbi:MAG: neutral/alkaline non-lysosomal ceramidase N-terminal domain-containing protein [Caldilineaceae bacterium]|nr:neutral/alkaline non-lysosomal ceramidase N-terminal domain-containing protein [Caldilineaceae bacterium]